MLRRRTAASADDVDQPFAREVADIGRHGVGRLVIAAEGVGKPSIGMGAGQRVGNLGEIRNMGAQFLGPQRAVQTDGKRIGMAHGVPERLHGLTGQGPARKIGDCTGNPHRQTLAHLRKHLFDGVDRGLGIQRVEHGLDHDEVGAAADERARAFGIGRRERIETRIAITRIVHVGRQRGGAVGRAQHAGHEAGPF